MTDQGNDDQEECKDERPIVIDNGSSTIKAGFASNDSPGIIFPTVVNCKNIYRSIYILDMII